MKKTMKKAQPGIKTSSKKPEYKGPWGKPTEDSTGYFTKKASDMRSAATAAKGTSSEPYYKAQSKKASSDSARQSRKGKPGYDENGRPMSASEYIKRTTGATKINKKRVGGKITKKSSSKKK